MLNVWAMQERFSFSSIFNARMRVLPVCNLFDFLGLFSRPTPVVLNWFHIFSLAATGESILGSF